MMLDYAILTAIMEIKDGAWKKKIHEHILDNRTSFGIDAVSLQTIGRHVATLQDEGHVTACILSPEELNRDYIIGFQVTENGREHREELRDRLISEHLLSPDPGEEPVLPKPAAVRLLADRFDLADSTAEQMSDSLSHTTLQALTAFHTLWTGRRQEMDEDRLRTLADLTADDNRFRDIVLPEPFRRLLTGRPDPDTDGTDLDTAVSLPEQPAG